MKRRSRSLLSFCAVDDEQASYFGIKVGFWRLLFFLAGLLEDDETQVTELFGGFFLK